MTVLVTGAGGFIGSHLVEGLLQRGHTVRALAHYNSRGSWGHLEKLNPDRPERLDVRLGDITDPYLMHDLTAGCDFVFHLAALIGVPYSFHAPASYVATNVCGTLNVLEACRQAKVRRVIVTSTSEVYGSARYAAIDESHPLQARSPYAASKIAADKIAESYFCSFDLPVVILRPFNIYGPRQSARAVVPTILSQAIAGTDEIRLGNLEPRRDLTFVDDATDAFLLALDTPNIEGDTIHFGQGTAISVVELKERCLDAVGGHARVVSTAERQRPENSEVDLLLCDASKARHLLGWTPRVPLDEGLRRTAHYLQSHVGHYRLGSYVM